MNYYKVGRT